MSQTLKHYLQFSDLTADEYAYLFTRSALIKSKFKAYDKQIFLLVINYLGSLSDHLNNIIPSINVDMGKIATFSKNVAGNCRTTSCLTVNVESLS